MNKLLNDVIHDCIIVIVCVSLSVLALVLYYYAYDMITSVTVEDGSSIGRYLFDYREYGPKLFE